MIRPSVIRRWAGVWPRGCISHYRHSRSDRRPVDERMAPHVRPQPGAAQQLHTHQRDSYQSERDGHPSTYSFQQRDHHTPCYTCNARGIYSCDSISLIPLEIEVASEPDAIWEETVMRGGRSPTLSNKREPGTPVAAAGAGTPALDGAAIGNVDSRTAAGLGSGSVPAGRRDPR